MNENKKPVYLSKTFWTNVILVVALPFLPESLKSLVSSPEALASIFAIINVALRLISKDKVTLY